jgi:hypothetical protein
LVDTGILLHRCLNHLQVVLAEALESLEGGLAVIGDGCVDALHDVRADIISAALAQLCDEIVNLVGRNERVS